MALRVVSPVLCFVALAAAHVYETAFNSSWDDANWRLETTIANPRHYQARAPLSNGYIGISVSSLGPFFESDVPVNGDNIAGWPLFDRRQAFATIAGFWDIQEITGEGQTNFPWLNQYGGVSIISGIPHWSGLLVEAEGKVLDASTSLDQISNFSSTYDFKRGIVSWNYIWAPSTNVSFNIEYTSFTHKLYVNQAATQLKITPSVNAQVAVIDVLDGDCAVRSTFHEKGRDGNFIYSSVYPDGIPGVLGYVYSKMAVRGRSRGKTMCFENSEYAGNNASSIAQQKHIRLRAGRTTVVEKFVGIASGDAFPGKAKETAKKAAEAAYDAGFEAMLCSHTDEWQSIMTPDSVDSYHLDDGSLPEDTNIQMMQIIAVTNPYYILQNTVSTNALKMAENNLKLVASSIPVCGWTADCYAGQIYWDVEVWMQPGLVVAFPEAAKQIAEYRLAIYDQAKNNIETAYQSSKANYTFESNAAIYPWTSGRYANCTAVGPCFDYEYHINGDIGLELDQYCVATGALQTCFDRYFPIYESIATMYADIVTLNQTTNKYDLYNATDPDEFANHVTNPAFTLALIGQHLNRTNIMLEIMGEPLRQDWATIAANLAIPVDTNLGLIKEFETMDGSVDVKQADVVLLSDFLDFPDPYTLNNLEFYAGRQSPDGPGMTYGVFSIVNSAAATSGCSAYTYQIYATEPYLRAPWFQYSEQLSDNYNETGFHPSLPFVTGMGGANQVTVFGYLGYRPHMNAVYVNPSMPPQISRLDYRTIYWQGHAINATANQTHTTFTRLNRSLETANATYLEKPIPMVVGSNTAQIYLSYDEPVYIENRRPSLNLTTPGNIAQCKPATSSSTIVPGQFPFSVTDGARSTLWQPTRSDQISILIVDLGSTHISEPISALKFDWAQDVPMQVNVSFSNSSDASSAISVYQNEMVTVELPFQSDRASILTNYMSNTTTVSLDPPVWSGRFAFLSVRGNQGVVGSNTPGPSVAEFAIVAASAGVSLV